MALGSNRDYIKHDKVVRKNLEKHLGKPKTWVCHGCGRKNYISFEVCPRCSRPKSLSSDD